MNKSPGGGLQAWILESKGTIEIAGLEETHKTAVDSRMREISSVAH